MVSSLSRETEGKKAADDDNNDNNDKNNNNNNNGGGKGGGIWRRELASLAQKKARGVVGYRRET